MPGSAPLAQAFDAEKYVSRSSQHLNAPGNHAQQHHHQDDERHPNSDDSISAYIHNTSSPVEGHASAQSEGRRSPQASVNPLSPLADAGSKESRRSFEPLKPNALPRTDEEDVAAASGMLSLRASQDVSSTPPGPVWRGPDFEHAHPASPSPPFGGPPRRNPCDEAFKLKEGAQPDAVLWTHSLSQSSITFPRPESSHSQPSSQSSQPSQSSQTQGASATSGPLPDTDADATTMTQSADASASRRETSSNHDGPAKATDASQPDDATSTSQQPQEEAEQTGKKRRRRTRKEEAEVLAGVYAQTAFPDSNMRQQLAQQLGMTTRAVSIWFQNRRQAERKRASRFGTGEQAAELATPAARSVSMSSLPVAAESKLQRWPSLDAFASGHTNSTRRSPASDDEDDQPLKTPSSSRPSRPLAFPSASRVLDVFDDKENAPIVVQGPRSVPVGRKSEGMQSERHIPKDIRDLVFGKEVLTSFAASSNEEDGAETPSQLSNGSKRSFSRVHSMMRSPSPLDRSGQRARAFSQAGQGRRVPFGRSISVNGAQQRRITMEHVMARSTPVASRSNRTSPSSSRSSRFITLSTTQHGRASLDGKASPPRKRPFIKSLSMSTKLPPALARAITDNDSAKQEDAGDRSGTHDSAEETEHRQHLLEKMQSSSSGSSDAAEAPVADDPEDEERTLRLAAERRNARAQSKGQDGPPRWDAMSELVSRPWARSASGPAARLSTPSLDVAASRDRSKPNNHVLVPSSPFGVAPEATKSGAMAHVRAHSVSERPSSKAPQPRAAAEGKRGQKRKSGEVEKRPGQGAKKGRTSNASTASAGSTLQTSPERQPAPVQASTPGGADVHTPDLDTGVPFGTPKTSSVLGKRSFGRSISAQYSNSEDTQSPVSRPLLPTMYASTPAPMPVSRPPGTVRGGSMAAPSMAVDVSAGREMTPRSLAFTLGLTHGSTFSHSTPYGAGTQTPYANSSIFASRYLPSSSRDARALPSRHNYSPLGKGREAAGMIGSTPSLMPRTSSDSSAGTRSISRNRMPFSNINYHQQPPPPPPKFVAPSASAPAGSSEAPAINGRPLPLLSAFASSGDKENMQPRSPHDGAQAHREPGVRRVSRSPRKSNPLQASKAADSQFWSSPGLDDSGFVDATGSASDEENGGADIDMDAGMDTDTDADMGMGFAARKSGKGQSKAKGLGISTAAPATKKRGVNESPTRVQQQRQRQHDAAQVLLGLAGEGR